MTFIQGEAQRKGVHTIEMLATKGGPVTQVLPLFGRFSVVFRSLFGRCLSDSSQKDPFSRPFWADFERCFGTNFLIFLILDAILSDFGRYFVHAAGTPHHADDHLRRRDGPARQGHEHLAAG
jgi:hypothetical protein